MKKTVLLVVIMIFLVGCTTTNNHYYKQSEPQKEHFAAYILDEGEDGSGKNGVGYCIIDGEINRGMRTKFWEAMLTFQNMEVKKVIVELHSFGGVVGEGMIMINMIKRLQKKGIVVETRANSKAESCAFMIFASGSPGHRLVGPVAILMWHPPANNPGSITLKNAKEVLARLGKTQEQMVQYMAERGNVSAEFLREKLDSGKNWYLGADEAIEYGFADDKL